jgi:hypothetical protein
MGVALMLLLLLAGGGFAPGVRAYAAVSFAVAGGSAIALTLVGGADVGLSASTTATATEE